jgi:hypothetical protein
MMFTVAATLVTFLPTAIAADNYYTSYVYAAVSPADWVGVGQDVVLQYWTADMPPDVGEIAAAEGGERAAWYNVGFYVTDPEGNTETITIAKTDPVGGTYSIYTPDQVGTYTVQAWFPATVKTSATDTHTYTADESPEVTFEVREEQREPWPEAPLPSGYWTRPINQASRDWYVLGGNWLQTAGWTGAAAARPAGHYGGTTERFAYGKGTESAHILWTKPHYVGGFMDERYGVIGYQTGHYQGMDFDAVVINGQMYYNYRADAHVSEGYLVVDLYTGETLRYVNSTLPDRGMVYNYDSPNQHGGYAYMILDSGVTLPSGWITESGKQTWELLDAYTGRSICKIANVSAGGFGFFFTMLPGTEVYGKDGSVNFYHVEDEFMQLWNLTAIPTMLGGPTGTDAWQWRPSGGVFGGGWGALAPTYNGYYIHDGNNAWSWNVSIPAIEGDIQAIREGEYIIIGADGSNNEEGVVKGKMTALSLEDGQEGSFLWSKEFTPPYASIARNESASGFFGAGLAMTGVYPEEGVVCYENRKTLVRYGVSLDTGAQIWEGNPEPQMNYYSMYDNYYKGMLLSPGWGGVILAYNITTGDIVWNYTAPTVGWESPYGNYPINIFAICDDKIYTLTGEHSISQPMYRGPNLRCINATNGEEIWSILGFSANGGASLGGQYAQMGDGKVLALNYFDNQIYCFGPGPSATTVSAPQTAITHGHKVMITGTVTDQTETGRRNTNGMFDFSLKGTPAISDEDMGAWMEYMFMQQGMPADAMGVEVILETLDPNGNFYEIGRTTSDINGNYGLEFEPPVPGSYQIFARFEGSAAYGSSADSTYMIVEDAPQPTPTPTPTPEPMTDTYVLGIGAGAIIAIIVVGLVIILMLRRR